MKYDDTFKTSDQCRVKGIRDNAGVKKMNGGLREFKPHGHMPLRPLMEAIEFLQKRLTCFRPTLVNKIMSNF